MSCNPGPDSERGNPVSSVSSCTTRASATASNCGKWETMPTAQSWVSASVHTGSAPNSRTSAANPCIRGSGSLSKPINAYRAPENNSASARAIPEVSFPAMGCPPRKRAPPTKAVFAARQIVGFVLPVSVTSAPLRAPRHARVQPWPFPRGRILQLKCPGNVYAAPGRTIRRSGRFRGWLHVRRELRYSSKARDSLMQISEIRQSARRRTSSPPLGWGFIRLDACYLRDVLKLFDLPHQRIFGAIGLHGHLYVQKVAVLGGVRGQMQQVEAASARDSQNAHQRAFALLNTQLQGEFVHRATSRATSCWCNISEFERPGPTIGQTFAS